jgi:hypothetical protein
MRGFGQRRDDSIGGWFDVVVDFYVILILHYNVLLCQGAGYFADGVSGGYISCSV